MAVDPEFQRRWDALIAEARRYGYDPKILSGYRSVRDQLRAIDQVAMRHFKRRANAYERQHGIPGKAAAPGLSRHQRGQAFDLRFKKPGALAWFRKNAPRYGIKSPRNLWSSDPNHFQMDRKWKGTLPGSRMSVAHSVYSPHKAGSPSDSGIEGTYKSAKRGLDGKFQVRTMADVVAGRSSYFTVAGNPGMHGRSFRTTAPIQFYDRHGKLQTLPAGSRAYQHDTGPAFANAAANRLDFAPDRDMSGDLRNKNHALWQNAGGISFALSSGAGDNRPADALPSFDPATQLNLAGGFKISGMPDQTDTMNWVTGLQAKGVPGAGRQYPVPGFGSRMEPIPGVKAIQDPTVPKADPTDVSKVMARATDGAIGALAKHGQLPKTNPSPGYRQEVPTTPTPPPNQVYGKIPLFHRNPPSYQSFNAVDPRPPLLPPNPDFDIETDNLAPKPDLRVAPAYQKAPWKPPVDNRGLWQRGEDWLLRGKPILPSRPPSAFTPPQPQQAAPPAAAANPQAAPPVTAPPNPSVAQPPSWDSMTHVNPTPSLPRTILPALPPTPVAPVPVGPSVPSGTMVAGAQPGAGGGVPASGNPLGKGIASILGGIGKSLQQSKALVAQTAAQHGKMFEQEQARLAAADTQQRGQAMAQLSSFAEAKRLEEMKRRERMMAANQGAFIARIA